MRAKIYSRNQAKDQEPELLAEVTLRDKEIEIKAQSAEIEYDLISFFYAPSPETDRGPDGLLCNNIAKPGSTYAFISRCDHLYKLNLKAVIEKY